MKNPRPAGTFYTHVTRIGVVEVRVQTDKKVMGVRMSDLVCMMPFQGNHLQMAERIVRFLNDNPDES